MPRLSPEVWDARKRHVLESAWRRFAHHGFHATSMDDVIAETGWSASVVYRYVSGKDELISSAGAEAFAQLQAATDDLLDRSPAPRPDEVVEVLADLFDDERHARAYSLAGLILHTWAEAVDDPAVADRGRTAWDHTRRRYAALVEHWHETGLVPRTVGVGDLAATFALLVPGLCVDRTFLSSTGTRGLLNVLRVLAPAGERSS